MLFGRVCALLSARALDIMLGLLGVGEPLAMRSSCAELCCGVAVSMLSGGWGLGGVCGCSNVFERENARERVGESEAWSPLGD